MDESPTRDTKDTSLSPGKSPGKVEGAADIDPELVRVALRDFAQKLKDLERERDEARAQVNSLQRQLSEIEQDRNDCEQRLTSVQKTLEESLEGTFIKTNFS